jgi:hypothetical protein
MFKQVKVEILGILENMAGYTISGKIAGATPGTTLELDLGDHTETLTTDSDGRFETTAHVFGQGGAARLAQRHSFPVLGSIPLNPSVRVGGDAGDPIVVSDPDSALARAFTEAAGRVAQRLAIREHAELPILQ